MLLLVALENSGVCEFHSPKTKPVNTVRGLQNHQELTRSSSGQFNWCRESFSKAVHKLFSMQSGNKGNVEGATVNHSAEFAQAMDTVLIWTELNWLFPTNLTNICQGNTSQSTIWLWNFSPPIITTTVDPITLPFFPHSLVYQENVRKAMVNHSTNLISATYRYHLDLNLTDKIHRLLPRHLSQSTLWLWNFSPTNN